MISSRDADMEARPHRYAAPVGTVMTDRGTIRPFFERNIVVQSPNGEIIRERPRPDDLDADGDLLISFDDLEVLKQPIHAGIISIWINENDDRCIWMTCRNAEGVEFECPWAWAECERSEQ